MSKMIMTLGLPNFNNNNAVDMHALEMSFNLAMNYLKTNICSFAWEKFKNCDSWKVSTWSKRVSFNSIKELGNDSDKLNLPLETRLNRKRKQVQEPREDV